MYEGRSAFKMLIGQLTTKRPLGWPRNRGEGNVSMDFKEIGINIRKRLIQLRIGVIGEPS